MNYWIIINEEEKGPFTVEELAAFEIAADTPVWCDGMAQWQSAATVPELAHLIPLPAVAPAEEPVVISEPQIVAEAPVAETINQPHETTTKTVIYAPANAIPPGYVAIQQGEIKCPNYLVFAILSTIICFLPLGICAIICSTKVKKHLKAGDIAKAMKMSERTALFVILSIVVWLIWMPFSVVFALI